MEEPRSTESVGVRPALTAVVVIAVALAVAIGRDRPPAPRGKDAPPTEFSAARAQAALARLLGDGRPHPVGSPANAAVRERLLGEIRALGLAPEVRTSFACNDYGGCATVANVFTRVPSTGSGKPILLLAHYDSVPAGPGAGDDGSGTVTLLETARALLAGGALAHPVWLLWTDGEEAGLLGAEAFAAQPEAREIGFLLNFEARGATGRSLMFETGPQHAGAIGLMAENDPHPAANSLSYEIYRRLPNDTDYTVFRRLDVPGFNFAFIGSPLRYHTPQDSLANLDLGTLQQDGDHALSMTRALLAKGTAATGGGSASYFDLAGFRVIHWPASWTAPLAWGTLLLVVAGAVRRRSETRIGALLLAWIAALVRLALAYGAAWLVYRAFAVAGPLAGHWIASPEFATLGFLLLGLAVAAATSGLTGRWSTTWERGFAAVLLWAMLAVLLATTVSGAAFIALVPALLAGLSSFAIVRAARPQAAKAPLLAVALAALLLGGLAWTLPVAMGLEVLPAVALLGALVGILATAAFAPPGGRLAARIFALVALVALVAGATRPRFTADQAEPLSLRYLETDSTALWYAEPDSGRLPGTLASALPWTHEEGSLLPWSHPGAAMRAPATRRELAPPSLAVESAEPLATGGIRFRLRVRSQRGAPLAIVRFPPEAPIVRLAVEGREMPPPSGRFLNPKRGRFLVFSGLPPEGQAIEVDTSAAGALPVDLDDQSPGLPPEGAALVAARGDRATPISFGDATVVYRHLELRPAPSPPSAAPPL